MNIEMVASFLRGLKSRTQKKEIKWYQGETDTEFSVDVKSARVTVTYRSNGGPFEELDYLVEFTRRSDNTFIVQYSDSQLNGVMPAAYKFLEDLYDTARMQVLGLDDVLMDALNEFGDDDDRIPF